MELCQSHHLMENSVGGSILSFSVPLLLLEMLTIHGRQWSRLAVSSHVEESMRGVPWWIPPVCCLCSFFVLQRESFGGLDPVVQANDNRSLRVVVGLCSMPSRQLAEVLPKHTMRTGASREGKHRL